MRAAATAHLLAGGFMGLLLETLQKVSFFRRLPWDRALDVIDTAGLRRLLLNVVTGGPKLSGQDAAAVD